MAEKAKSRAGYSRIYREPGRNPGVAPAAWLAGQSQGTAPPSQHPARVATAPFNAGGAGWECRGGLGSGGMVSAQTHSFAACFPAAAGQHTAPSASSLRRTDGRRGLPLGLRVPGSISAQLGTIAICLVAAVRWLQPSCSRQNFGETTPRQACRPLTTAAIRRSPRDFAGQASSRTASSTDRACTAPLSG
jgi:hypothetical protein